MMIHVDNHDHDNNNHDHYDLVMIMIMNMIIMIMTIIREVETAKEGRLGLARELRRQLVAGEQVGFFNMVAVVIVVVVVAVVVMVVMGVMMVVTVVVVIQMLFTSQAELVGCGDGRKLSCLSPIGDYSDYPDHCLSS